MLSSYKILSVVPTVCSNLKSNISNCSCINLKLPSPVPPTSNVFVVESNVISSSEKSVTSPSNNNSPDKSVDCDCCLAKSTADSSDNNNPESSSNTILSPSSASVFKTMYALLFVASSKSKLTEWCTTICSRSSVCTKSGEVLLSKLIAPPMISTSADAPPPLVPELLNTTLSPTL